MRNLTTSVMTVRNMKNRIFFNMVLNSFGHNRFETSMSLTPKTLGNYTIIGTLGTGTSAKVKLAEHIETHRKVALKILKKNNLESKPEFFSKIQQEISLMSLFDHPHIIRLYEVFESEKHLFLALEYCENGDLFDFLIQGQKLSEEEAMNYFRQLIYALEYLHLHEICHRDLKPENLLLDSHNSLKIGDFGFALWMRDKDSTKSCGSPHYAAPEIIQGRAYSGKKVDIWSAGVILYAMITGGLPFDDEILPNLLKKIEHGEYDPPITHPEIRDLISRMIVVDPNQRYSVENVKEHPAFSMFLPDEYIPPKPLPLPFYSSPIDVDPIQYNVMKTLQQVGFNKDELIKELTSNGQNMAKVFYFMLIRLIDYTALPWHQANSGNTFLEPDQDETQLWTYDSLDSGIDFDNENCLSLAEKIDWDIGNKLEIDFKKTETITISGHSLAEIMYEMQEALVEFYYYYFHPDDQTLLATKDHETFIIINAELKEESSVSLKVNLFSGSDDDFDELIEKIREIVQDSLA